MLTLSVMKKYNDIAMKWYLLLKNYLIILSSLKINRTYFQKTYIIIFYLLYQYFVLKFMSALLFIR